ATSSSATPGSSGAAARSTTGSRPSRTRKSRRNSAPLRTVCGAEVPPMSLFHRASARMLLLAAVLLGCGPAAASFHLWTIDELYSSADGKVQFMEMTALAPAQEFLSGHTLTAS